MIQFFFTASRTIRLTITSLYLLAVALLSLLPMRSLPSVPAFPGMDKLVHAIMYLGLSFLLSWSFHAERSVRRSIGLVLISAAIGWSMELIQLVMHAGRSFDPLDEAFNITGTLLGTLFYVIFYRDLRRTGPAPDGE